MGCANVIQIIFGMKVLFHEYIEPVIIMILYLKLVLIVRRIVSLVMAKNASNERPDTSCNMNRLYD